MKLKNGFLQVGLVVAVASILTGYLVLKNVDFSSVEAKKVINYWKDKWDKCPIARLCKAPVVSQREIDTHNSQESDSNKKCKVVGYEGCLVDYNCSGGTNVEKTVRNPNCGRQNAEEAPNPTPTSTPTNTPAVTPTPTPTSTPESTPTATPVPSGTPNYCGGTCGSNYNCQGGLFCYQGFCRNPDCPGEASCGCRVSTPTPPPVLGASTPPRLPETGSDDLEVLAGLLGIAAGGFYIFKKFELI